MKIGIGYTVHNRHEIALKALRELANFMPSGGKLVVVDDASKVPFKKATFRFEDNVGIARAKNKCLELLDDCDAIFIFDEDTWPKADNWWEPYINSGENHLMFTFDKLKDGRQNGNRAILSKNGLTSFANPCGCMLYLTKKVLEVVGGMDTNFIRYGYEHPAWSLRIFNAGLTKRPFQDVNNSLDLFHSLDWACEVKSSVTDNRGILIRQNKRYYDSQLKAKHFIPYKEYPNYVLSSAFVHLIDPQRGEAWKSIDGTQAEAWLKSLPEKAIIKIFTDHAVTGSLRGHKYIQPTHDNPYFQRWFAYRDYLKTVDKHSFVWCTDLTDVKMLRNPFPHMKRGVLYCGDEQGQNTMSVWMRRHHTHKHFDRLYRARLPLLNAGIVGGEVEVVLEFCERICELAALPGQMCDMAAYNQMAYEFFKGRMLHGPQVNTVFKQHRDNGIAWWQHK